MQFFWTTPKQSWSRAFKFTCAWNLKDRTLFLWMLDGLSATCLKLQTARKMKVDCDMGTYFANNVNMTEGWLHTPRGYPKEQSAMVVKHYMKWKGHDVSVELNTNQKLSTCFREGRFVWPQMRRSRWWFPITDPSWNVDRRSTHVRRANQSSQMTQDKKDKSSIRQVKSFTCGLWTTSNGELSLRFIATTYMYVILVNAWYSRSLEGWWSLRKHCRLLIEYSCGFQTWSQHQNVLKIDDANLFEFLTELLPCQLFCLLELKIHWLCSTLLEKWTISNGVVATALMTWACI